MYLVLIIAEEEADADGLAKAISKEGLRYELAVGLNASPNGFVHQALDAAVLDLASLRSGRAAELAAQYRGMGLPVVAVTKPGTLADCDPSLSVDDFVMQPLRPGELELRVRRAISKVKGSSDDHVIRLGDLVIDRERYEVSVAGRKVQNLTYKEYQLLVLLASTPGRVYGREALLSQVWGYDYFGGTRTVDVHIRRLRSKIEDSSHLFIETVRNVGYRLKA